MLNGMRHLDALKARFGPERVLGGLALISATLDADGTVRHLNDRHSLVFGELDGAMSARVAAIQSDVVAANFDGRATDAILQEMWEKWVFLATLAACNCLMRGSVGDILASPGGRDFILGMLDECSAVAAAEGHYPRGPFFERTRGMLTAEGSQATASMFRDIKVGAAVEADHVIGDLLARGDAAKVPVPKLRIAYTHLKVYERQRT
jgi:2-dehydropantoate 2-reductase